MCQHFAAGPVRGKKPPLRGFLRCFYHGYVMFLYIQCNDFLYNVEQFYIYIEANLVFFRLLCKSINNITYEKY